jgi:hypothetical protein
MQGSGNYFSPKETLKRRWGVTPDSRRGPVRRFRAGYALQVKGLPVRRS